MAGRRVDPCLTQGLAQSKYTRISERTRMQSRVYHLLCLPELRRHALYLSLLVRCDQLFRMLETGGGDEQRSVLVVSILVNVRLLQDAGKLELKL